LARTSQIVCVGYRSIAKREGYTPAELYRLIAERGSEEAIRQQRERYRFLVACSERDILGLVGIEGNEIAKLYVDPEYRRQGVGRKLYRAAEKAILDSGHKGIVLGTFPSSVPFYQSVGMTVVGARTVECGTLEGRQNVIMEKRLVGPGKTEPTN